MESFPPPSMPVTPVPVGNGRRFGAFVLEGVLTIVTCGIGWLIWAIVLWQQSTTPAKKLLGMRILDAKTGAPATMSQMVRRELLVKLLLIVALNYAGTLVGIDFSLGLGNLVTLASAIMVLTSTSRQALWDLAAGTVVVDAR
ncbi:MAG: RDD family protein [Actinobacteria bacterium]|nr:RDD family protein [Actinomycetota bacterium]